jgi:hypothetical protein
MSYLDTSILTAFYCPEPRSERVQEYLSGLREPTISPLVQVEFCSAIAGKLRAGGLDIPTARRILARFDADVLDSLYRIVPVAEREYRLARRWLEALSSPLRALDALHLAAASSNGLVLATCDRDLARAAEHFGVRNKLVP